MIQLPFGITISIITNRETGDPQVVYIRVPRDKKDVPCAYQRMDGGFEIVVGSSLIKETEDVADKKETTTPGGYVAPFLADFPDAKPGYKFSRQDNLILMKYVKRERKAASYEAVKVSMEDMHNLLEDSGLKSLSAIADRIGSWCMTFINVASGAQNTMRVDLLARYVLTFGRDPLNIFTTKDAS